MPSLLRLKFAVSDLLWRALGRRNYARLGRFLWMQSRLDVPNDPHENGEYALQEAFAAHVARQRRVVVIDVGANVGDWTDALLARLSLSRGEATMGAVSFHLFEPSPPTRKLLEARRRAWSTRVHIEIASEALGDTVRRAPFFVFDATDGTHTLSPLPDDAASQPASVEVECTTLDRYAATRGIERVDLLKIDTEGNDCNVLAGAKGLLGGARVAYLQFEYNHRWIGFRRFLKDAFDLLLPLGYHIGKITPKGIEPYPRWHPELESFREGNYLSWHGSALELPIGTVRWWLDSPS